MSLGFGLGLGFGTLGSSNHGPHSRESPLFHLVRPIEENGMVGNGGTYGGRGSAAGKTTPTERAQKAIPEIFLTRLLSTKGTIQKVRNKNQFGVEILLAPSSKSLGRQEHIDINIKNRKTLMRIELMSRQDKVSNGLIWKLFFF